MEREKPSLFLSHKIKCLTISVPIENDKIVVFKIDISKLNQSHLHNDKNIILEEGEKPYSFEYTENISPDYLQICEKED